MNARAGAPREAIAERGARSALPSKALSKALPFYNVIARGILRFFQVDANRVWQRILAGFFHPQGVTF